MFRRFGPAIALLVVFVWALSPTGKAADAPPLTIVAINVGQGDSTLVVSASGATMLIDGGRDKKSANAVLRVLKSQGVSRLDTVVVTHYDSDHIGGLDDLLKAQGMTVGGIYDPGPSTYHKTIGKGAYAHYIRAAGDSTNTGDNGKRHPIHPGKKFDLGNDAWARCVVVNGDLDDGITGSENDTPLNLLSEKNSNARSVGILITSGEFEYLTCGDLTSGERTSDPEIEYPLVLAHALYNTSLTSNEKRSQDNSDIDVYHVNHHGAETSSGEEFVRAIMPEVSLISCGGREWPNWNNGKGYRHPRPDVLFLLGLVGSEIFVTGKGATNDSDYSGPGDYQPPARLHYNQGNITVEVDGDSRGYWVRPQRGAEKHVSSLDGH